MGQNRNLSLCFTWSSTINVSSLLLLSSSCLFCMKLTSSPSCTLFCFFSGDWGRLQNRTNSELHVHISALESAYSFTHETTEFYVSGPSWSVCNLIFWLNFLSKSPGLVLNYCLYCTLLTSFALWTLLPDYPYIFFSKVIKSHFTTLLVCNMRVINPVFDTVRTTTVFVRWLFYQLKVSQLTSDSAPNTSLKFTFNIYNYECNTVDISVSGSLNCSFFCFVKHCCNLLQHILTGAPVPLAKVLIVPWLTCPGGLVKPFPHDVSIESSCHGELGEGVGNSRPSVKRIPFVMSFWLHNVDKIMCNPVRILTLLPFLMGRGQCSWWGR